MIVYLNGQFQTQDQARISPFDRGFLFGDGVYEGLRAFDGHVVAMPRHVARMAQGLTEAGIRFDPRVLEAATAELLERNGLRDAFVYWQVTRGTPLPGQPVRARVAPADTPPTAFAYAVPTPALEACSEPVATRLVTVEDRRWHRGQLKSISLLGNVLSAMESVERGATDALLVRDGMVGEACSTNVVLALPEGSGVRLVTPCLESVSILAGVTRAVLLDLMPEIEVRPVRVEEATQASEIMLLGTLSMVMSVVELDGRPVGEGKPGPAAKRMLETYLRGIRAEQREGDGAWKRLGLQQAELSRTR